MADVNEALRQLLELSREAAAWLAQGEPDPDKLSAFIEGRTKLFEALQQTVEQERQSKQRLEPSASVRAVVDEILALDKQCMTMAQKHMETLRGDLSQVQLQQRSLTAYGWVDPENAPRGAFLDTTHE